MASSDIWFVYDGECPICQIGATYYKVRQAVGQLHTVDARTEANHPVMLEVNQAGLDLDEGMVIKFENQLYQGEQALILMAKLGADAGAFNKVNNFLFQSAPLARLLYPAMKGARNLALKFKGVG